MKVTPLPYQISLVKAPTSNIIKRFLTNQLYTSEINQNELYKARSQSQSQSQIKSK